jgi:C-terminal processing protease CtpA/Prc
MRSLVVLFIALFLVSCNQSKKTKNTQLNKELVTVTDSISQLMVNYHYNPKELDEVAYLKLEKEIQKLATTVDTKEAFIEGFNQLWSDGPFSHVGLAKAEKPAEEIASFIDSMRVGDQSVSLNWEGKTAILTVTTMTGVDTKERVFEAYHEIDKKKAEALVIDIRNNTGGTFAGIPLIGHLMNEPIDVGMFVSRKWWQNNTSAPKINDVAALSSWEGWSIKTFWKDVQEQPLTRVRFKPMLPYFDGPVYVLTSKKTASAAEFTVDAMAHLEKVTLIGETTAGEMLSQKMFDLPHGFQLSLPIAEYYSTRIGRIEGKGVEPDITIDQSVAMELAMSLIKGEELNVAIAALQEELNKMGEEPLGGEAIYLFGNMNEWGKKWDASPRFEYKGKGIYETTTKLKKGTYEFKIAPMNWDYDFGAKPNQEKVTIGTETSMIKKSGSDNLKIELVKYTELTFRLDLSNKETTTLTINE